MKSNRSNSPNNSEELSTLGGQSPYLPPIRQLAEEAGCPFEDHSTAESTTGDHDDERLVQSAEYLEENFFPEMNIDGRDIYDQWLWTELKGKPLTQWKHLHTHRKPDRKAYGEGCETKLLALLLSHDELDVDAKGRIFKKVAGQSADAKHSEHERDRRLRHAVWQRLFDLKCGDFVFELADKYMDQAKEMIHHKRSKHRNRSNKVTGKDEQFLSSIFHQRMAAEIATAQAQLMARMLNTISTLMRAEPASHYKRKCCHHEEDCLDTATSPTGIQPRRILPVRSRTPPLSSVSFLQAKL